MRFIIQPFEHGHPKAYEPEGLGGKMTVALYDMWTKPDPYSPANWVDVDVRSDECSQIYSESVDFDSSFTYIEQPRRIVHTVDCSSSSVIPESLIEEEYGESNENRWKRRPIRYLDPDTYREDGNRWPTGFRGFHNFVVEFKRGEETSDSDYLKVSPDNAEDGICRFQRKENPDDPNVQYYKNRKMSKGSYYVSFKETGTKSVGHYFGENPSTEYALDWVEGIFYSSFDTSDVGDGGNFKVTAEPSYDADEVPGRVYGEIEIYAAPRRWAYYARSRVGSWTDDYIDIEIPATWHYQCTDIDYRTDIGYVYNVEENMARVLRFARYRPPMGTLDFGPFTFGGGQGDNNCPLTKSNWCTSYWVPISDSGAECINLVCVPGVFSQIYEDPPLTASFSNDYIDYTVSYEYGCTGQWYQHAAGVDPTGLHTQGFDCDNSTYGDPFYRDYGDSFCKFGQDIVHTQVYTIHSRMRQYDHRIGIWWDRFPTNLDFVPPTESWITSDEKLIIPYYYDWENATSPPLGLVYGDLVSESLDDAKQHAEDAGLSEEDVNNIFSGYHSIATYSSNADKVTMAYSSTRTRTNNTTENEGPFWESPNVTYSGSPYSGTNIYMTPWRNVLHTYFADWSEISDKFENDPYVTDVILPTSGDTDENFDGYFPAGLGISPDKAGSLVGIITEGKSRNKILYVWRKTDEEFEVNNLSVRGNYEGHKISFESHNGSGNSLHTIWNFGLLATPPNNLPTREKRWRHLAYPTVHPRSIPNSGGSGNYFGMVLDLEFVDQFWHSESTGRLVTHVGGKPDPENSIYKTVNTDLNEQTVYDLHKYPYVPFHYYEWDDGVVGSYQVHDYNSDEVPTFVGVTPGPGGGYYYWYRGWSPYKSSDGNKYSEGEEQDGYDCGMLAKGIHTIVRDVSSDKVELPAPILFVTRGAFHG